MTQNSFEEICDRALKLGLDDRAKLAADLIASLGPGPVEKDEGYDEAWAEEIERRLDAIHDGSEATRPAEEVFAEMRKFLDELRSKRVAKQGVA
jgi:putative addiction module component (TIGR02574 family)